MTQTFRTAIVTGGSKGIGAAIALRLARDGHAVVVNYARDETSADEVVASIERAGGKACAVKGDVADPHCLTYLFDAGEASFGPVHVLVNNA
ncbi:MAG: SDR family NAD(P)-dependent oxidoreductase, partial [Roseibium sp.]